MQMSIKDRLMLPLKTISSKNILDYIFLNDAAIVGEDRINSTEELRQSTFFKKANLRNKCNIWLKFTIIY
jgi:hypothetical protein